MKRLQLKEKEERRLLRGHLWAFRNELAEIPAGMADGQPVDLYAARGQFVGRGFYQAQGGIAMRIATRRQEDLDEAFFTRRITEARAFREKVFRGENVYRWVFGESDGIPGLVADRYGATVVAQSACAFYRNAADDIARAFLAQEGVRGVRLTVGSEALAFGEPAEEALCSVDGVQARVDLAGGQKTGLFLDQRLNWRAIEPFAPGARVLDGHCYVGMWSCHAARAGAAEVLGVDTSEAAVARATEHAALNGVGETCRFERADVMEVLTRGDKYDLIVLDPPALAKSRAQVNHAMGLYLRLNRAALEALNPGGLLATSSCSHFVDREDFLEMLKRAATSAQRKAWFVEVRGAAPDHPVLLSMPETAYLKCALLRTLD